MKYVKFMVIALILACSTAINVNASEMNKTDFSISANYSWVNDNVNYAKKLFDSRSSAVQWTNSNKSSHKMWFRVRSATGTTYGSALLNYKTTGAFRTDISVNTGNVFYLLGARRENITDPVTNVTGLWMP